MNVTEYSTLKQQLIEVERLSIASGTYSGIKELSLYDKNPFLWEQAAAKLIGTTVTAREVCANIAASPITRSIGETCFVLFTPEGDAAALSTGIIVHVRTMSEFIKYMIRNGYEKHPGINEGDIFANCDPAIGNVHTADVQTVIPIFYQNKLVGWAGGVTHQVDIGGNTPGHSLSSTTTRYEDGLNITAEKIGVKNKLLPHYVDRSRNGVRTPLFYDLDEKARIAGVEMIRRSVIEFIDSYGLEDYKVLTGEMIELSRRNFVSRAKERLVPGRFRSVGFSESPFANEAWQSNARKDTLHHLPSEMWVKPDGNIKMDYEGNSGYGPWPWNASTAAVTGTLWVILTQIMGYGEYINEGYNLALDIRRPKDTWLNCDHIPQLSRQNPWWLTAPINTGLFRNFQRSFFGRGMIEESCAGFNWLGEPTQGGMIMNGRGGEPKGLYGAIATFELGSAGFGASPVRDGLDHGYGYFNPESDMGDVEVWERTQMGLRYLSRQIKPNTAGYGRRRGGTGFETMAVFYGVQEAEASTMNVGYVFNNPGLAGGYPNSNGYILHAHDTNIEELWKERKNYPQGDNPDNPEVETNIKAEIERKNYATYYPRSFKDGDLIYMKYSGGPGYGDPLERELELCEQDLNDGIYTLRIMKDVFGVIANENGDELYTVDHTASTMLREQMRKERKVKSIDFADFYLTERKRIINCDMNDPVKNMYNELVQIGPVWWNEFSEIWQLTEKHKREGLS